MAQARKESKRNIKITFGSLAGFAMSGEGIPTLQADQLNVIAHHINSIRTNQNVWTDPTKWPAPLHSMITIAKAIEISKLQQKKLQKQPDWNGFLNSECI